MKVFVLSFMGPAAGGGWFGKFIGVYSSQRQALFAVERYQGRPGFSHYPQGFQVDCVQLDEDYEEGWTNLGPVPPSPDLPPP
jgi:hypothetical protein